jgi:predicted ATPase
MENRHVVLSGCSGGGKTTLLKELGQRGFAVVAEPGRRIVQTELRNGGSALPWSDPAAFARLAMRMAENDRKWVAGEVDWVFFDRGLIDAAVALQHIAGHSAKDLLAPYDRYYKTVFLTPPWPEIFVTDAERQHDFTEAIAEYERLRNGFEILGYRAIILPKVDVRQRADLVLSHLCRD